MDKFRKTALEDLRDLIPNQIKDILRQLLLEDEIYEIPSKINYSLILAIIIFAVAGFCALVSLKYLLEAFTYIRFYKEEYKAIIRDKIIKMLMWFGIWGLFQMVAMVVFVVGVSS